MKRNIIKVLEQANHIEVSEGRVAYFRYKEVCHKVAEYYGYPRDKVIACFAALSPNLDYRGNVMSLVRVVDGHSKGIPVEQIVTAGYNHTRDRAYSYLGDVSFWDTVKGKKIRSFYQNIKNPMDSEYVTIDGHAANIVRGKAIPLKGVKDFNYDEVAEAYKDVARRYGLLPHQLQAITWLTWKRMHSIREPVYQLHLFEDRRDDVWRTLLVLGDFLEWQSEAFITT